MDTLETIATGRLIEVRVTGKLTKDAYENFVPLIEGHIKQHGKLRILFVMQEFHGWTAGAMWEDFKFDLKHWKDIERLALVGDKKWEKGMAAFCKPFTKAHIRYFDLNQLEEAHEWLESETVPEKSAQR
jgi:SpoIIAA-like